MPAAFETYARQLRYQALGTACRDSGIETLLMGHHRDDSIETTIGRLATGARHTGLGGIQEVAPIPECHGIFGVSESGSSIQLSEVQNHVSNRPPLVQFNQKNKAQISWPPKGRMRQPEPTKLSIATGGISLCRPLLTFPKTMLLETCHQNKIPYVSDPTNFDPTLTPRNAIRDMLAHNYLPRALQPASIRSLMESSKDALRVSAQSSDQLLADRCRVLDFNPKTGIMIVQILQVHTSSDPLLATHSTEQIRDIQSFTLRRITELVSPTPAYQYPLRNFEPFVSQAFKSPRHGDSNNHNLSRPFTLGSVMFYPLTWNPLVSSKDPRQAPSSNERTWMVSRQPFPRYQLPVSEFEVPFPGPEQSPKESSYGPWLLWDDRFWFRYSLARIQGSEQGKCHSSTHETKTLPLVIRPFQLSDWITLRHGDEKWSRRLEHLRRDLQDNAPDSTRFTIPLLTRGVSKGSGQEQSDKFAELLALPTLSFSLSAQPQGYNQIEISHEGQRWKLGWQWMYKSIDTEALRLMSRHH